MSGAVLSVSKPYAALASALIVLLAACGGGNEAGTADSQATSGDSASQNLGTVRVGLVCGGVTPLIPQVAMAANTFPASLDVEPTCFDAGSEQVQALVGGSIDVAIGSIE